MDRVIVYGRNAISPSLRTPFAHGTVLTSAVNR
jgi:hypothetical protein